MTKIYSHIFNAGVRSVLKRDVYSGRVGWSYHCKEARKQIIEELHGHEAYPRTVKMKGLSEFCMVARNGC